MAEDDRNPNIGNRGAGSNPSDSDPKTADVDASKEGGRQDVFVDRDDDSPAVLIDRDYDDDFPGSSEEPEDADPGYAAFASELDDPLADWPAPDSSAGTLPEQRQSGAVDKEAQDAAGTVPVERQTFPAAPAAQPPKTPDRDELVFSHEDDDAVDGTPDVVDTDRLADGAVNVDPPPTAPEPGETSYVAQEDAFDDDEDFAPEFEEEFVDDFLNDLDPPNEIEEPDFDAPEVPTMASSSIERAGGYSGDTMPDMNQEAGRAAGTDSAAAGDNALESEERSLPIGMIAVVVVALILLGIGGYGVVQQRSEMQAEIRELQARLATAITPEAAEAERESQRQIQLRNESLSAELEALTAENRELASQLAGLENDLKARAQAQAQAEAAAEAERKVRQAAAKAAQTVPAATSTTAGNPPPKGPWFVNFGSYADQMIARRWADKLSVNDGEVVVQSASAAGKTLYRVRVIGLTSQDAAERVATTLERQYQLPRLWVGKG